MDRLKVYNDVEIYIAEGAIDEIMELIDMSYDEGYQDGFKHADEINAENKAQEDY